MSDSLYAENVLKYDSLAPTESKTKFVCDGIVWGKIADTNQGNYNSHYINFSALSSQGQSPDTLQAWSQGHLELPNEAKVEIFGKVTKATGATDADTTALEALLNFEGPAYQRYGLCPKNPVHMIDNVQIKWNNVVVNQNENFQNIFRQTQMLSYNDDKMSKYGQIYGFALDDGKSITYDTNVGEINNLAPATSTLSTAHTRRCQTLNYDFYNVRDASNQKDLLKNIQINKLGGCISNPELPISATNPTKSLTYHWFQKIKLADINDFFNALPQLGSVTSFDLRFQTNCGPNSYWIITYEADIVVGGNIPDPAKNTENIQSRKIASLKPVKVEYSKSAGMTCPYMIGELSKLLMMNGKFNQDNLGKDQEILTTLGSNNSGTYVASTPLAVGKYYFQIKLSASIGSKTSKNMPCNLYIPSIKYESSLVSNILKGSSKIFYNDFVFLRLDGENKITGNTLNRRINFNMNLSKVNMMYVIPMLANSARNTSGIMPYESPLSSCPTTFTSVKIKDLQLLLGNNRLYPEKLQEESDFFDFRVANYYSTTGSMVHQDTDYSTQLTLDRFRNGYAIYPFDLTRTVIESQFVAPRSYQMEISLFSDHEFELFIFFRQEKNLTINHFDGTLVADAV
jgi:hypothetical protein